MRSGILVAITAILALSAAAQKGPAPTEAPAAAALSPFIDVHTHLEKEVAEKSIQAAVDAMTAENTAKYLFLPSPFDEECHGSFDIEFIQSAAAKNASRIISSGGGGTLNPMIEEAVRARKVIPELEKRFRERAEEIVRKGAVGFGELTAEHRPSASTPSYQSVPPDHPLFLLLADIAAQHNMPITLHLEAVTETMPIPASWHVNPLPNPPTLPANIEAFERLLAHNPRAKVVWAHLGSDNTGFRTPELSRRLLKAHPNLYMELKVDPLNIGLNSPLAGGSTGKVKPEWLKLFQDFPDRFVIGSDQHYPMPKDPVQRWQTVILLFNQLPSDLQHKIGMENVARIYNLK